MTEILLVVVVVVLGGAAGLLVLAAWREFCIHRCLRQELASSRAVFGRRMDVRRRVLGVRRLAKQNATPLGYTRNHQPIYPLNPSEPASSELVVCCVPECRRLIRLNGGPLPGARCPYCYETEHGECN